MDDFRGQRVTVAGLGHFGGGPAVARWLVEQGAKVLVTDREPAEKLSDSLAELAGLPIEYQLGGHRETDFTGADLVVASPAIPPANPFLQAAGRAGVAVTTEIRLFVERCPNRIVGVTGTKGKSTATAMLGRMLATRHTTWVGGNIGKSLLADLPNIGPSDIVVLELSSYMLHHLGLMRWSPHIALVTLIAPDHLEWHGGFEGYVEAKRNIVRFQRPGDFAVLNGRDDAAMKFAEATPAQVISFAPDSSPPFRLLVPGMHNQLNAQAAFAAARLLGVTWEAAQSAVADFPGLPHRLQLVHEAGGVRWFNDSIATIPEAAVAAMESFPPGCVIQIVGGYDKQLPLESMCRALAGRAKAVLCIGATGPAIAAAARNLGGRAQRGGLRRFADGDPPRSIASSGDVILLSTGSASYDQFVNFEHRGEMFARLAREEQAPSCGTGMDATGSR